MARPVITAPTTTITCFPIANSPKGSAYCYFCIWAGAFAPGVDVTDIDTLP